jgi:hypothetical protein
VSGLRVWVRFRDDWGLVLEVGIRVRVRVKVRVLGLGLGLRLGF